jgi:cytochrome c-type biogenesis protein
MSGIGQLVQSGPLLLAMPVAAAAGAVTFLSPCCLPLVPGYLSYITGMSATAVAPATADEPDAEAQSTRAAPAASVRIGAAAGSAAAGGAAAVRAETSRAGAGGAGASAASRPGGAVAIGDEPGREPGVAGLTHRAAGRRPAVVGTALFVLGFSAVFASEGLVFGAVGEVLKTHQQGLAQVLGCVIIVLGLLFAGAFDRFTFAGRIVRPSARPRAGLAGAPLLGVLFGLSWTPCIGPTLAVVLALAGTTGTASRGALLAFVYGLGLGVPFLVVAFAVQRGMSLFGFARRHARQITRVGGVMLIAVGLLEVTGAWATAVSWLQVHWLSGYVPPL